jgi:hypothetical protein
MTLTQDVTVRVLAGFGLDAGHVTIEMFTTGQLK